MKLKKIASLMLAGVMAVSMLAACGDNSSNNTPVVPPVDNTTSTGLSAQLGEEASDLTNSKVTFADSTALNNALKHAVGNIGDNTIDIAFAAGLNNVTFISGNGLGSIRAAATVLDDDMDTDVPMVLNSTIAGRMPLLAPTAANYDENNWNLVLLFAVDSGVEEGSIVEQINRLITAQMDNLVTSYDAASAAQTHDVSYNYTCSVASTSKTFVDADTTFGLTFVAVEINRVLGV